jgi:hypothetical protein
MKNSNDIIGNRTHDLPACSAVPQPTAPLRTRWFIHTCRSTSTKQVEVEVEYDKLHGLACYYQLHSWLR